MGIDFSKIQQVYAANTVNKVSSTSSKAQNAGSTESSDKTSGTDSTTKYGNASGAGSTAKYGNTIGDVKLSDKAAEYYNSLKTKFSNMNFVLVSEDEKTNVESKAAMFATPDKTTVLINVEKVEQMAQDESYRKKYEDIIQNNEPQIQALQTMVQKSGSSNVQGVGMKVDDGGLTSFFAVLKKSSSDQKTRIAKKAEEKKAEKKEQAKKDAKKTEKERLESHDISSSDSISSKSASDTQNGSSDDTITISASSAEELLQKIQDYELSLRSDSVQTDAEKLVGQHIDFKG